MDDLLSVTLHSKSLASTGRAIDKNRAVLPIEESIGQRATIDLRKHFLLRRFWAKNFLERVHLLLVLRVKTLPHHDLRLLFDTSGRVIDYFDANWVAILIRYERADSSYDIDGNVGSRRHRHAIINRAISR